MQGNVAFDQGIVGALLATQVVRPWPVLQRTVIGVVVGALLLFVARIYGLPLVTPIVNALPVLGNLGEQYLWISVGLLFTITVAFGLHGLLVSGPRLLPLLVVAAVIGSALAYTTISYGLENVVHVDYLWVAVSILAAGVALIISKPTRLAPIGVALCLVVVSWGELTFYVDHARLQRYDRFSNPAPFVRFLQKQTGLYRVASYGPSGVPPEYGSAFGLSPDRVDELSIVPALCRSFQPPDSARSNPTLDLVRHPGEGTGRRFTQSSQFRFSGCEISADAFVIRASSQLHGETFGLAKGL